jgi:hypothetical protein
LGGVYVGPTQDHILCVAKQVSSVEAYNVHHTKGAVTYYDTNAGKIEAASIDIPPFGTFALLNFNLILVKMEKLLAGMNSWSIHHHPSLVAPNVAALDNMSVQE